MDDIARAARVAKPTLYRYFANKEELFLESLEHILADLYAKVVAAVETAPNAPQALRAFVAIVLDALIRYSAVVRALDGGDPGLGGRARRAIRTHVRRLRLVADAVLKRGIAEGTFLPTDSAITSRMILGAVRMNAADGRKRHAAEVISKTFLRGLGTSDAQAVQLKDAA